MERRSDRQGHSPNTEHSQAAFGGPAPVLSQASSSASHLSLPSHPPVTGQDEVLQTWAIHSGSKCPASVQTIAGPFVKEDFFRIGIDKSEVCSQLSSGCLRF